MLTALRRRWVLVLALFVIVCFLGLAAINLVPADYKAEATVALVPPTSEESPKANRYLLLGGLNPARDIVIRSLGSDESRESMIGGRDGATYELEPDFTTSAPIIVVTAVGTSQADANEVLTEVLAAIPMTLASLQDQVGDRPEVADRGPVVAEDSSLIGPARSRFVRWWPSPVLSADWVCCSSAPSTVSFCDASARLLAAASSDDDDGARASGRSLPHQHTGHAERIDAKRRPRTCTDADKVSEIRQVR